MKEHYVLYDCAVKLKELGFDFEVNQYYNDKKILIEYLADSDYNNGQWDSDIQCSAPRLDQAQAWLREVKGIDIEVTTILRNPTKKTRCYMSNLSYFSKDIDGNDCGNYIRAGIDIHSYEKALELGIDKALELLTNQPTAI